MSRRRMLAARRRVDDGWWLAGGSPMPVAAYQPIGAASLAASYVNLANPGTFDAALGVAPTWASGTGWGSDGTRWLNSNIVPQNNQQWSMVVRFSGATVEANYALAGSFNNSIRQFVLYNATGGSGVKYANGSQLAISPELTSGVVAVAGSVCYRNGVAEGGALSGWGGSSIRSIYLMAENNGGANAVMVGNIQAVAIYSSTLTAPQVAAVSAAMAAL